MYREVIDNLLSMGEAVTMSREEKESDIWGSCDVTHHGRAVHLFFQHYYKIQVVPQGANEPCVKYVPANLLQ